MQADLGYAGSSAPVGLLLQSAVSALAEEDRRFVALRRLPVYPCLGPHHRRCDLRRSTQASRSFRPGTASAHDGRVHHGDRCDERQGALRRRYVLHFSQGGRLPSLIRASDRAVFLMAMGAWASVPCIICILANNTAGFTKRACATALQLMVRQRFLELQYRLTATSQICNLSQFIASFVRISPSSLRDSVAHSCVCRSTFPPRLLASSKAIPSPSLSSSSPGSSCSATASTAPARTERVPRAGETRNSRSGRTW